MASVQLAQHVVDVSLDRPHTNNQVRSDLLIVQASRHQFQHLLLAFGQGIRQLTRLVCGKSASRVARLGTVSGYGRLATRVGAQELAHKLCTRLPLNQQRPHRLTFVEEDALIAFRLSQRQRSLQRRQCC